MQSFPDTPRLEDAPELTGHLWIQERATGGWLRFRMAPSGALTFGTKERTFDPGATLPLPYRRAAGHVRAHLDRDALRAATDDPAAITFFGIATRYEGLDYDWTRLPAFLGVDVWTPGQDGYISPDAAASAYRRLGLSTLPAIEKETPIEHLDLQAYTDPDRIPDSEWYDGPVAGLLVRDKTGGRARIPHPSGSSAVSPAAEITPETVVEGYVTIDRIDRAVRTLRVDGREPTVEAIIDRVVQSIVREAYAGLYRHGEPLVPWEAVRSTTAERVKRYWSDREAR